MIRQNDKENEMGKTCSIHDRLIRQFSQKTLRKLPVEGLAIELKYTTEILCEGVNWNHI